MVVLGGFNSPLSGDAEPLNNGASSLIEVPVSVSADSETIFCTPSTVIWIDFAVLVLLIT